MSKEDPITISKLVDMVEKLSQENYRLRKQISHLRSIITNHIGEDK